MMAFSATPMPLETVCAAIMLRTPRWLRRPFPSRASVPIAKGWRTRPAACHLPPSPRGIRLTGIMTEAAIERADVDPVATVYDAYREFLVALVCRKFRVPQEDALGLVHEVFVSFLRCRHEIENQRAWLIAAACNAARGYWRRQRDDTDSGVPSELQGAELDVDVILRVAEVLGRLPERFRRVLELRYLEGHSTRELATILNTTPGYAEKLVHESLLLARAAIGEAKCT